MILKEEMKARTYVDPWTPPRSSAGSKEALHNVGYDNGCKRKALLVLFKKYLI